MLKANCRSIRRATLSSELGVSSKRQPAQTLPALLGKYRGQRTVLGIALPVLAGHISALNRGIKFDGLTEDAIRIGFNELAGRFIKSEYHSTYLARRLGRHGFLELAGDKYFFPARLLAELKLSELEQLHEELLDSLKSAYEQRQLIIRKLEDACSMPEDLVAERHALIDSYLSQLSGNRGEIFEVMSFAVLREYFRTFGFSLQRFSTTHANDGGMDFVASDAIYQVTTDESANKLLRDLAKAPGTKRVLVRPSISPEISRLSRHDVLETVELRDLLNHFIGWLLARDTRSKSATHLQAVLRVALDEFRRENRASV